MQRLWFLAHAILAGLVLTKIGRASARRVELNCDDQAVQDLWLGYHWNAYVGQIVIAIILFCALRRTFGALNFTILLFLQVILFAWYVLTGLASFGSCFKL